MVAFERPREEALQAEELRGTWRQKLGAGRGLVRGRGLGYHLLVAISGAVFVQLVGEQWHDDHGAARSNCCIARATTTTASLLERISHQVQFVNDFLDEPVYFHLLKVGTIPATVHKDQRVCEGALESPQVQRLVTLL